jgi:hypothetical protein
MTLWRCDDCSTRYSVGAPRCPQCSGTDHTEDGEMPKIHKGRPNTGEPVEFEPVEEVLPAGVEFEPLPEVEDGEQVEHVSVPRSRGRGPRRPVVRAHAGHAAGSGEAPEL